MNKGDVFTILRFEAKRLLRREYLWIGLVFSLFVVVFMRFGDAGDVAMLLDVIGSLMMAGLGLGLWRGGVSSLRRQAVSPGKHLLISLLGRGFILCGVWCVVPVVVFGDGRWSNGGVWAVWGALFFWFFYLSGAAVSVVVRNRRIRCLWAVGMWVSFVFVIPRFLDIVVQRFQLPPGMAAGWPVSFFSNFAMELRGGSPPVEFATGVWMVLFYLFLPVGVVVLAAIRKEDDGDDGRVAVGMGGLERGKFYFLHIKDPDERGRFVRYFESKDAVVVRKLEKEDLDEGVRLKAWLEFLSGVWGRRLDLLLDNLRAVGIERWHLRKRLRCLSIEALMSAYWEVKLDCGGAMFVFDDVLEGVSDESQDMFRTMVKEKMPDAVCVYIGSRMYESRLAREQGASGTMRFIAVDPAMIAF